MIANESLAKLHNERQSGADGERNFLTTSSRFNYSTAVLEVIIAGNEPTPDKTIATAMATKFNEKLKRRKL